MSVKVITGNIFTSQCQTIVNTINCVGVMGAGLAFECRLRYPEMYEKYVQLCQENKIDIGLLWIYKSSDRWVLNFPTKRDWKYPSKTEYLRLGLEKFVQTYQQKGIQSIAFPLLGADKGGIPKDVSLDIMMGYLDKADIDIEIYRYDPLAYDDLYAKTKRVVLSQEVEAICQATRLRKDYVSKVISAMQSPQIVQLNQLAGVKGIGIKTLEKIFKFADSVSTNQAD